MVFRLGKILNSGKMKYEQDQSYFNPKARWVETALKSVQSVLQAWCPMCPSQAFKYDLNSMPKTLSTKSSKQLSITSSIQLFKQS